MTKKTRIIFTIISIILILFVTIPRVHAVGTVDDVISDADNFLNLGDNTAGKISEENILNTSQLLYNILMVIGIIVAVTWGIILGIKFVTGALGDKAELIIYVFGCIVIFGATTIWKLVVNIAKDF